MLSYWNCNWDTQWEWLKKWVTPVLFCHDKTSEKGFHTKLFYFFESPLRGNLLQYPLSRSAFSTADSLTFYCRKSTGVTNNVNYGCFSFRAGGLVSGHCCCARTLTRIEAQSKCLLWKKACCLLNVGDYVAGCLQAHIQPLIRMKGRFPNFLKDWSPVCKMTYIYIWFI